MTVSICTVTFNHENLIAQAIESFLSQKTKFDFEIIIGDDYSTDQTHEIVKRYVDQYPDRIKLFRHDRNIGMMRNFEFIYFQCKGKYIAMCDGDDYWTDEFKLQKQVDFLEANPDFSISYHRVVELFPNGEMKLEKINKSDSDATFTIDDLAKGNFIHTPSVLFRNNLFIAFPNWYENSPVGDYVLHMLNARYGKIKYFATPMAVYRKHTNSMWSSQSKKVNYRKWIQVLDFLLKENFEKGVIEELKRQRRNSITTYLNILLEEENGQEFLALLQDFIKSDPLLAEEWLLVHYPKKVVELQARVTDMKRSLSNKKSFLHRCADKLSSL